MANRVIASAQDLAIDIHNQPQGAFDVSSRTLDAVALVEVIAQIRWIVRYANLSSVNMVSRHFHSPRCS